MRAALALLLVASLAGAAPDRTVAAGPQRGASRIGPYHYGVDPTFAAAVRAFGEPTALSAGGGACTTRWAALGLAIRFGPSRAAPCTASSLAASAWMGATLTSSAWHTATGLRVGDTLTRLRSLYPGARAAGGAWLLVYRRGEVGLTVYLQASIRAGRVTALVLPPGNVSVGH